MSENNNPELVAETELNAVTGGDASRTQFKTACSRGYYGAALKEYCGDCQHLKFQAPDPRRMYLPSGFYCDRP